MEKVKGLDHFENLLKPLVYAVEETFSCASQLYSAIDFEFIVNFVITRKVLEFDVRRNPASSFESR